MTPEERSEYARWVATQKPVLPRVCARCQIIFLARNQARYCSPACRIKAWRQTKKMGG